MEIARFTKASFAVLGKEGSTDQGEGFIQRLWADANGHFSQIAHLALQDDRGRPAGIWGAMTDCSRAFLPWEEFRRGLYLAGVECAQDVRAPEGWVKWTVPGFEYLRVRQESRDTFREVLSYMRERSIPLSGAVQEFYPPDRPGAPDLLFPVRRL